MFDELDRIVWDGRVNRAESGTRHLLECGTLKSLREVQGGRRCLSVVIVGLHVGEGSCRSRSNLEHD